MNKLDCTVIGKKKTKKGGFMYYFTWFSNDVDGNACCSAYHTTGDYDIGDEVTVIESNFRYMILD